MATYKTKQQGSQSCRASTFPPNKISHASYPSPGLLSGCGSKWFSPLSGLANSLVTLPSALQSGLHLGPGRCDGASPPSV
ncbi:hypothetical protein E2C01_095897 [Portunus trituberculatus]|uniref:Uncharacterized protein n=1 Tax=Portunus trituberculatus TaxID=210409 RepID=A0A5B7K0L0_PORTR|nr:hypothetical protein [Portunus trituberculatus]